MPYAPVPIKRTMQAILALLQAEVPDHLTTASLPAIASWTFATVFINEENQLPQVVIDLQWARRPISAGGGVLPHYTADIIVALPWTGTVDNYLDGTAIASVCEGVMYDEAKHDDGSGTLWNAIINKRSIGEPVGEEGVWQGGHVKMLIEGVQINY
jgi:hypothetical protein